MLIILSLLILYMILISPNLKRRGELDKFKINYYHRGYFDNQDIAENSLEAFDKAIKHDTAIELDVHITKDKKLVVIHDNNLSRMTGHDVSVKSATYEEIKEYQLLNTQSHIPLLDEVLKLVSGKVCLYIELKDITKDYQELVDEVIKLLKDYKGEYILCSFNPLILAYLRKKYPKYYRGLIIENYHHGNNIITLFLQTQILNIIAKPDLISFRYTDVSKFKAKIYHFLNVPLLAWSIKTYDEYQKYHHLFDGIVLEKIDTKDLQSKI